MDTGKGIYAGRKIIVDKGDASAIVAKISEKKDSNEPQKPKPEGLNWVVAGTVLGAPVPVVIIFGHWADEKYLTAFQESEFYKLQEGAVANWTSHPTQDYVIHLYTEAFKPQKGHILEFFSFVSQNDQQSLRGEFENVIIPNFTGSEGFVKLGFGHTKAPAENENKVIGAFEWASQAAYESHRDSAAYKEIVAGFNGKVKDFKNYGVVIA